ncbi:hypothetical protein V6N12_001106 [Hibiscus sabdariffa]|uniref:F-box domain-containing protein n=1 Tax=Hibiscus sabdariffa TaxID=183260 RepID=A0ABR2C698_9ROSI
MAKLVKYHGSLDNLPDPILCHILSFLPARDGVRTSILSPRWRYRFISSISKLDLDDIQDGLPNSLVPDEHIESFKKFVDRLFSNPKHLSLESFRVSDDRLTILNWLCAALLRCVKEIDVHLFREEIPKLSTVLFTCPSLVTLKLNILPGYELKLPSPTNVCLPNLRTLHLSGMGLVDGCSFHGIISGCPVLQDFDLSNCHLGASELNIHSLSLRRLVLDFEHAICKVHVLHLSIIGYDDSLFQRPLDPVLAFHHLVELEFKNPYGERTVVSLDGLG